MSGLNFTWAYPGGDLYLPESDLKKLGLTYEQIAFAGMVAGEELLVSDDGVLLPKTAIVCAMVLADPAGAERFIDRCLAYAEENPPPKPETVN